MSKTATARANSNIAFIKYWGNQDNTLRIPGNPSISMNLDGIYTETTVTWDDALERDECLINGEVAIESAKERVSKHLDRLRERLNLETYAKVDSVNNFPMGAGIASSASAFAALTVSAIEASGQQLSEREVSTLARLGSGSASRSVPTGFVEWHQGDTHETSYAESFAPPHYWDLIDVIAIVSDEHKHTGSYAGHHSASTSILQDARVAGATYRFRICKDAILGRDFSTFAQVVEEDSNLMHAVMMTSRPPLFYWKPATLTIMEKVRRWRDNGIHVCYTLDAGPNVHCICIRNDAETVSKALSELSNVLDVRVASAGQGTQIIKK